MHLIRRAVPSDAAALSRIAHVAKRHWGYPESWLIAWSPALTLTPAYVADHLVLVGIADAQPVGFGALTLEGGGAELDHLWVLPTHHDGGLGRRLLEALGAAAGRAGAACLRIESDPHAGGFYERCGARWIDTVRRVVAGTPRELPVYQLAVGPWAEAPPDPSVPRTCQADTHAVESEAE